MIVFLPRRKLKVQTVLENMRGSSLAQLMPPEMSEEEVDVSLPRFSTEFQADLNAVFVNVSSYPILGKYFMCFFVRIAECSKNAWSRCWTPKIFKQYLHFKNIAYSWNWDEWRRNDGIVSDEYGKRYRYFRDNCPSVFRCIGIIQDICH